MKLFVSSLFISLLAIGSAFRSEAQEFMRKVDSLKKVLPATTDTARFDVLFELAFWYSNEMESESLIYATQAYDLALQLGDTARIIKGGRIKTAQLRRTENFDASIQLAKHILPIAKRHKDTWEVKVLLTSLANSHNSKAEYDKALKYNFESLAVAESERNMRQIGVSLANIGLIYFNLNDLGKALEYNNKAVEIKRKYKDHYSLDLVLINTSLCYSALGDPKRGEKYAMDGLNSCEGKCTDQIIAAGEFALGVCFFESGLLEDALRHFSRSYELAKHLGNYGTQADNLFYFAKICLRRKDYNSAEKHLLEVEKISLQKKIRGLSYDAYRVFSELYNETKDYKKVAFYQAKYIAINDSIYGKKITNNLAQLREDFEERENKKIIAEKNEILSLQAQLLEKQRLQTYLVGSIALLLLILTVVVYKNYREKLLINNRLDQKVKERTEELREVNSDLTKAYELRESVIRKTWQDTQGIISGMYGLCHAAQLDLADDKAKEYIHRFEESASRLTSLFSRIDN